VLLIAMMLSSVWGGSLWVVIVSVGIGFGVNIARVTRPELRRVLHSDFVTAGRASGLTPLQNLWRHLLPNVAPVFIVQLSWAWRSPSRRGRAQLPRLRRAADRAQLGPAAEGPADLHLGASALRRLAGPRDHDHGARVEPARRRPARGDRPDPVAAPHGAEAASPAVIA
jgi:hypothetical protein